MEKLNFLFLTAPVEVILQSIFSRNFYNENLQSLYQDKILNRHQVDKLSDPYHENLLNKKIKFFRQVAASETISSSETESKTEKNSTHNLEDNIIFNPQATTRLTNLGYDFLHENNDNLSIFSPLALQNVANFPENATVKFRNDLNFELFRSQELIKFKHLVKLLHIFEDLLVRLILEDKCSLAFIRLSDCSIIEYFHYIYSLYNSEAFDCFRGKIRDREYPEDVYQIDNFIVDYFGSQNLANAKNSHSNLKIGWRFPISGYNLPQELDAYGFEKDLDLFTGDLNFIDFNGQVKTLGFRNFEYLDEEAGIVNEKKILLESLPKHSILEAESIFSRS